MCQQSFVADTPLERHYLAGLCAVMSSFHSVADTLHSTEVFVEALSHGFVYTHFEQVDRAGTTHIYAEFVATDALTTFHAEQMLDHLHPRYAAAGTPLSESPEDALTAIAAVAPAALRDGALPSVLLGLMAAAVKLRAGRQPLIVATRLVERADGVEVPRTYIHFTPNDVTLN